MAGMVARVTMAFRSSLLLLSASSQDCVPFIRLKMADSCCRRSVCRLLTSHTVASLRGLSKFNHSSLVGMHVRRVCRRVVGSCHQASGRSTLLLAALSCLR